MASRLTFTFSALVAPHDMTRRVSRTDEPSKASLKEMPEITAEQFATARRNPHVGRARKSLEIVVLDKKVVKRLGGNAAIHRILQALADSLDQPKKKKHHAA